MTYIFAHQHKMAASLACFKTLYLKVTYKKNWGKNWGGKCLYWENFSSNLTLEFMISSEYMERGTSALYLNESIWIIDGSNELIVDFLFALVLFLDSTQPWPFKNPKQIFFFGSNKRMTCKSNSNAKPNPGQHHSSFHLLLHSNAGLVFLFSS